MGISKGMAEFLISLGMGIAELFDYKLKVVLDKHEISIEVVNPDEIEDVAYEKDHYVNGNLFIDGYSNPIKPVLDKAEDKLELISSDRYKDYMRQDLVKNLIKSTEGTGGKNTLLLLAVVFSSITMVMMAGFFLMLFM